MATKSTTIKSGQTLSGIAKSAGTTVSAIMKANPTIKDANKIQAGASLNLPGSVESTSTNKSSPTITASEYQGTVDSLKSDLDNYATKIKSSVDSSALKRATAEQTKLLEGRLATLESNLGATKAGINTDYGIAANTLKDTQAKEYAGRATSLITSGGGFLGATQSQEGVLQNLSVAHEAEKTALMAKRDAAIQAAQDAYDDKAYDLAAKQVEIAKAAEQEIYNRTQDYNNNILKLADERRSQTTFENTLKNQFADLAVKYPSAGITSSDTIDTIADKIKNSSEYKLDRDKAELDIANTRSLINERNSTASKRYKVSAGDTIDIIASKNGLKADAIISVNPGVDPNNLQVGQVINLPTGTSATISKAPSKEELTQFINSQMATQFFKDLSKTDKALYILSQGGTPSDFGY